MKKRTAAASTLALAITLLLAGCGASDVHSIGLRCGIPAHHPSFDVTDALQMISDPKDGNQATPPEAVKCVLEEIGTPQGVLDEIATTPVGQQRKTEFGRVRLSWFVSDMNNVNYTVTPKR